ncbi:MAG: hypothetical protein AAF805_13655 [Planctomycetota bacterium]
MWCRHCQQQTPAFGPPTEMGQRCASCGRTSPPIDPVRFDAPHANVAVGTAASDDRSNPDATRRAIYRRLRSAHATIAAGEASSTLRYDLGGTRLAEGVGPLSVETPPPARRQSAHHQGAGRPPQTLSPGRPRRSPSVPPLPNTVRRGQNAAWGLASLGALVLGLGIGLGVWSLGGDRPALWNPAIAATLAGQGLLILGLLQLLAGMWLAGRAATAKLSAMHEDVRRLRRLADESAGRHHASAAAFYGDLARDAPNERLVGHLRGQLDALASRLRAG